MHSQLNHSAYQARIVQLLDDGVYASVSHIGDAKNISKSCVSRILRLALLAPVIVEAISGVRRVRV